MTSMNLKHIRIILNLTTYELAQILNCSEVLVMKMLAGQATITDAKAMKIENYFKNKYGYFDLFEIEKIYNHIQDECRRTLEKATTEQMMKIFKNNYRIERVKSKEQFTNLDIKKIKKVSEIIREEELWHTMIMKRGN